MFFGLVFLSSCGILNLVCEKPKERLFEMSIFLNILFLIIGMALLIKGADFFVGGASAVAKRLKVPAIFIGLTIVALGTSLPELVTSIVAAKKGENELALGNVVGSNIINISLILGTVGLISQAPISTEILTDMVILLVSTVVFVICCVQKANISKWEGILFLSMYAAYLTFAIIRNYCF